MAKIAETFECKALINAPEFNISKGNIYIVRPDHPLRSMFLDKNLFERMDDPAKVIKIGDAVLMDGTFEYEGRLQRVKKSLADIIAIEPINNGYKVTLRNANGCTYCHYTKSIGKDHNDNRCICMNVKIYWFISSTGAICRTYEGKDRTVDDFRRKAHDMFDSHEQALKRYETIIGRNKS